MRKCPNCGQPTARTEDWACQCCGYPLLSKYYKKVPKTYKQLQGEKLHKLRPPVEEGTEDSLLQPEPVLEPEPILETKPVPEPESVLELESIPEPGPAPKAEPELTLDSPPEPTLATIEITVEELFSAYEVDGVAAGAKFANNILRVTGGVSRIEVKDTFDVHYIMLTSPGKELLQNVRCMFDKGHGDELNQLIKGETVTVQGKYDGSIMEIRLRDCVLVY